MPEPFSLSEFRDKKRLSQRDLHDKLQESGIAISTSTMYHIEHGQEISETLAMKTIEALNNCFGLDLRLDTIGWNIRPNKSRSTYIRGADKERTPTHQMPLILETGWKRTAKDQAEKLGIDTKSPEYEELEDHIHQFWLGIVNLMPR